MVDSRSLRANPRPSSKGATLNSITRLGERRRARSVPIDLAAESASLLANARSLKRKRTARKATTEEDMSPVPATQPIAGSSKGFNVASGEGNARSADVGGVDVQDNGLLTPAPSQSQFTSGSKSRRRDMAVTSKDKGKKKARSGEAEGSLSGGDATSSHFTPVSGRPIKRRRIDRPGDHTDGTSGVPKAPTWLETLLGPQEWTQPDDDARTEAELETNFHLLDIADVTALPNVPVDPAIHHESADSPAEGTVYVPPAVAHLLEAMHHALATERRARQRAEALHAFEHTRCQKLEEIAVALRQKNALLEVEARAWAARTALSASDPSAFAALGLSVDGELPAAPSEPVDVRSLPQIRPPPAGAPSPSFTLVDTRQTGVGGTRSGTGRTADAHSDPQGSS